MGFVLRDRVIKGNARFMCPICDAKFFEAEVTVPCNSEAPIVNVNTGEPDYTSCVLVTSQYDEKLGQKLYLVLKRTCSRCNIEIAQAFPVEKATKQ